jgi:peptide/nickel transport system substrate-binding protein
VAGRNGLTPVPDLATDLGTASADGLTWTFRLKSDVRFGPPIDRPVTSNDVEFAFRRIDSKASQAQYGYLYDGLIEGMDGPVDRMPPDIFGIEAPDPRTVIFHLSHPAGDFAQRLALPATAPMPPEVAGCFTKAGDYGRDVVSTGPYMIQGADVVDASRCRSIEPMTGFQPTRDLYLVRNPAYDAATDDPAVRESHPDTIDIGIITNTDEIADLVGRGVLDASLGVYPDALAFAKAGHPSTLRWRPLNRLEYISMNVLVPPFDDVHVRRAVNLVLDRAAMINDLGDSAQGEVATGLFPPWIVPGPDATGLTTHGDVAAARQEMSMSAYDGNGDGVCDADACRRIIMPNPPSTHQAFGIISLCHIAVRSSGL